MSDKLPTSAARPEPTATEAAAPTKAQAEALAPGAETPATNQPAKPEPTRTEPAAPTKAQTEALAPGAEAPATDQPAKPKSTRTEPAAANQSGQAPPNPALFEASQPAGAQTEQAEATQPGAAKGAGGPGRMSFFDHLGELRRRLVYALLAMVICAAACWNYAPELFEFMRRPLADLPTQKMIVLGPMEMFMTYIKLAVLGGLLLSSPFVLLQLWLFVAPGLYATERRWVVPFVVFGSSSFIGGAAFCFFLVLPASFKYLIDMVPLSVEAHYSVSSYFALITQLMLAFGAVFELPLIMTLLAAAGIVRAKALGKFRRYWIVLAVIIGGVLTPTPDPMTQLLMAVPLIVFFEFGILGARLVERRRRPAAA